jgi:hypothetical protein
MGENHVRPIGRTTVLAEIGTGTPDCKAISAITASAWSVCTFVRTFYLLKTDRLPADMATSTQLRMTAIIYISESTLASFSIMVSSAVFP